MLARPLLFLSSLSPGMAVAAVRLVPDNCLVSVVLFVSALVLFPTGLLALRIRQRPPSSRQEVTEVRDETFQVATYIITFVFPFLFIDITDLWDLLAYGLFLVLIALLVSRSDVSIVNPGLILCGYHLYALSIKADNQGATNQVMFISKDRPKPDEVLHSHHLANQTYIASRKKES